MAQCLSLAQRQLVPSSSFQLPFSQLPNTFFGFKKAMNSKQMYQKWTVSLVIIATTSAVRSSGSQLASSTLEADDSLRIMGEESQTMVERISTQRRLERRSQNWNKRLQVIVTPILCSITDTEQWTNGPDMQNLPLFKQPCQISPCIGVSIISTAGYSLSYSMKSPAWSRNLTLVTVGIWPMVETGFFHRSTKILEAILKSPLLHQQILNLPTGGGRL